MRDDSIYFQHVAESIDLIQQYLAGADGAPNRALFFEDRRTQDAVQIGVAGSPPRIKGGIVGAVGSADIFDAQVKLGVVLRKKAQEVLIQVEDGAEEHAVEAQLVHPT